MTILEASLQKSKLIDKISRTLNSLVEEQKKSKFERQLEGYLLGSNLPDSLTASLIRIYFHLTNWPY